VPDRAAVLGLLTEWALAAGTGIRLAVDGPDAAGKSMLAEKLAAAISDRGRPVVRASIDGFHRPAQERYRRGELSPEGYYHDSFDLAQLRSHLLDPLGPGGNRVIRTSVFDSVADLPVAVIETVAPDDAVLVFDGVFVQGPELIGAWDGVVFLEITEEEVLRRAMSRDAALMGPQVRERYERRYLPAQQMYRDEVRPLERADIVIDNTDPYHPVVVKAPWR
jgi:uridine kinase